MTDVAKRWAQNASDADLTAKYIEYKPSPASRYAGRDVEAKTKLRAIIAAEMERRGLPIPKENTGD